MRGDKVISTIEKRVMAMDLRKRGLSYREIAERMTPVCYPKGDHRVSQQTVFQWVQAELLELSRLPSGPGSGKGRPRWTCSQSATWNSSAATR